MGKNIQKLTKNVAQTQRIAKELGAILKNGGILALYGDLGSGNTTFAQGVARSVGITQRIISPTFIIMREYDLKGKAGKFYHVDLYRIKDKKDIEELGLKEIMDDRSNIIVIEWPERLGEFLPKNAKKIQFNYLSEKEREITYEQ